MGDSLAPRVKTDGIGTVSAEIAEQGTFPATETVIGNRYRQRHVDADHADFDIVSEITGDTAITGKQAGAVSVFVFISDPHRLLQALDTHHA